MRGKVLRYPQHNLCSIIFECSGSKSVWTSVLPYCILNCTIMILLELLFEVYHIEVAFSITGHQLMTLMISFLVISKVTLSYDRYMHARDAIGHAMLLLRQLNQTCIMMQPGQNNSPGAQSNTAPVPPAGQGPQQQKEEGGVDSIQRWKVECTAKIMDLMDCTIRVIRDEHQACYLARNSDASLDCTNADDDPMFHVHALRLHLYRDYRIQKVADNFTRFKLLDLLDDFTHHYRSLLKLASTPLPFPMIQMARTFLFLWTFSIPFVLRGVINEIYVGMIFVFFLTYGFIGLEIVSMKLMFPFGDGANDLNVTGIREATVVGIKKDLILFGDPSSFSDRQLERSKSNDLSSRCGVVPQLDANNMYLDPRKAPPIPPSPSASSSGSSYDFAAVAAAAPPTAATTAATMYRQLDENL